MQKLVLGSFIVLTFAAHAQAQSFTTSPCQATDGNTNNSWFFGHQERACELRRVTLPLVNGRVQVSGTNGGIEVQGEDRSDIALEARVITQASSREEAEAIGRKIKIVTGETIEAQGPTVSSWIHGGWSVNYKLHVPRHLAAHLHTMNGGIEVMNVDGKIDAETTNGGLTLDNLAGDVHARTVNGGMEITLAGGQWQGSGFSVSSTNGGISVKAPENYSAHLIADTVNGGISVDLPMTGHGATRNHLDTTLGQGGATIQFETVNGGVTIKHSMGA